MHCIQSSASLTFVCTPTSEQSADYHQRKSLECSWNAGNAHQCLHNLQLTDMRKLSSIDHCCFRDWHSLLPTTRYHHLHHQQHIISSNPPPTKATQRQRQRFAWASQNNVCFLLSSWLSSSFFLSIYRVSISLIECAHLSRWWVARKKIGGSKYN